jgi:hypothetical protein
MAMRTISGSADFVVEVGAVRRLLDTDPQLFQADVTGNVRLADGYCPVRHLVSEEATVELDKLVGQFAGKRLVGIPDVVDL